MIFASPWQSRSQVWTRGRVPWEEKIMGTEGTCKANITSPSSWPQTQTCQLTVLVHHSQRLYIHNWNQVCPTRQKTYRRLKSLLPPWPKASPQCTLSVFGNQCFCHHYSRVREARVSLSILESWVALRTGGTGACPGISLKTHKRW
jgi:hypothetical protein